MPVIFVTAPELTSDARALLAGDLTAAVAAVRDVPADKIQVFFRQRPGTALIAVHVVGTSPDDTSLEQALRPVAAHHLSGAASAQVGVELYAPDWTARAGRLRPARPTASER